MMSNQVPVQMYYFILGVCHCVAFSSCVSNPVLYGWLNTNLRKEFLKVCQYDDDDDDDDDIYIMMKCLSVCLSRKMITSFKGL